jgi:hypothetical protein
LGIPEWTAFSAKTNFDNLGSIDLDGLTYGKARGYGAVISSFAFKPNLRKVHVLLAGEQAEQDALRQEVTERLMPTVRKNLISVPELVSVDALAA